MVSLWHLLIAVCVATPVGAALAVAIVSKAGIGGYTLVSTLGLFIGLCCAWAAATVRRTVDKLVDQQPVLLHERYFRSLYFAMIFWTIFAGFLGARLSSILLRLL